MSNSQKNLTLIKLLVGPADDAKVHVLHVSTHWHLSNNKARAEQGAREYEKFGEVGGEAEPHYFVPGGNADWVAESWIIELGDKKARETLKSHLLNHNKVDRVKEECAREIREHNAYPADKARRAAKNLAAGTKSAKGVKASGKAKK